MPVTIALPPPEDRSFADVWSALGGELKPSLDVVVSAPTETGQRLRGRPPVAEPAAGRRWAVPDGLAAPRSEAARRRRTTRRAATGPRPSDGVRSRARRPGRCAAVTGAIGDPTSIAWLGERREDGFGALVAQRRADDPAPDDPFRGLYLSDETVDRLLRRARPPAARARPRARTRSSRPPTPPRPTARSRLRRWPGRAGLTALDVELLLIALVPDLDSRFERLYGYLNDDVTRRRATVGLALELAGRLADVGRARGPAGAGRPAASTTAWCWSRTPTARS